MQASSKTTCSDWLFVYNGKGMSLELRDRKRMEHKSCIESVLKMGFDFFKLFWAIYILDSILITIDDYSLETSKYIFPRDIVGNSMFGSKLYIVGMRPANLGEH